MGNTTAEAFIRRHIQRILLEEEEKPEDDKKEDEPQRGRGQIWSGIKGGRLPAWAKEILGGGKKGERLASTNPAQLMKNLKISGQPPGKKSIDRIESLIKMAQAGRPEMGEAFGKPERRKDKANKEGVFVPNSGLPSDKQASVFVYDTIRGADGAGKLKLTGNVRIESISGGTLIFNVSKRGDRWE